MAQTSYSSRRGSRRPTFGANKHRSSSRAPRNGRNKQNINPQLFVKSAKKVEQLNYDPEHHFADFKMNDLLKKNLIDRGYEKPSKIQDLSIPHALQGKDVVGIANTGTGKTAAFLLPIIHKLLENRGQRVLILAPTRELALQIQSESRLFAKGSPLRDILLIGGVPIGRQLRDLQRNPEIVIGTPGRVKDHLERNTLRIDRFTTIVLDEVDRMLDMGFITDIREILSKMPDQKQSLFYSATMSPTIEALIRTFTHDPETIMARTADTSDNVEQTVMHYDSSTGKVEKLHELLIINQVEKTLVFCETKRGTESLSKELGSRGFTSDAIHGNKSQGQRQRALRRFRDGEVDILVATDVAARGIDVEGITHVVNFDLPQSYEDYTHRIGRTGRGDKTGFAVTFVEQNRYIQP